MKPEGKFRKALNAVAGAGESAPDYWLTRFIVLRLQGFTYLFAFLSLALQLEPLLWAEGLTPVRTFLESVAAAHGGGVEAFWNLPSLLWLDSSDTFMLALASAGLAVSSLITIGYCNSPMLAFNWAVYLSFVNAGQVWYGYGWETQLLETGFLAIFLAPALDPRPFPEDSPPPRPVIWLFQILALKVYLGSGLIKLRGSECWEDLTCLERYFETQPIPNPVSPWMHHLPDPLLRLGTGFTHFAQLVAPLGLLGSLLGEEGAGRKLRIWGGIVMASMQLVLIATGNLSFLNWVTLVAVVAYFDDRFLERLMPARIVRKAENAKQAKGEVSRGRAAATWLLVALVAVLSVPVFFNLFIGPQAMNTSFNQFRLVNSYGAFGSIRPHRTELVVQGYRQGEGWRNYDFRFKPDAEDDPLRFVAPYQPRMAWQLWFASMSTPEREPWLMHWTWKELRGEKAAGKLVAEDPFGGRDPDRIRVLIYRFEYREPWKDGPTWRKRDGRVWMPPVSEDSEQFRSYIRATHPRLYGE